MNFCQITRTISSESALLGHERPELDARHGADVLDHAGRGDARRDIGRAAEKLFAREDFCQTLDRLHAVLEGDDERVLAHDRSQLLGRALRVPELHGKHHDIDGLRLCGIGKDLDG
jgi:hypothetical protein